MDLCCFESYSPKSNHLKIIVQCHYSYNKRKIHFHDCRCIDVDAVNAVDDDDVVMQDDSAVNQDDDNERLKDKSQHDQHDISNCNESENECVSLLSMLQETSQEDSRCSTRGEIMFLPGFFKEYYLENSRIYDDFFQQIFSVLSDIKIDFGSFNYNSNQFVYQMLSKKLFDALHESTGVESFELNNANLDWSSFKLKNKYNLKKLFLNNCNIHNNYQGIVDFLGDINSPNNAGFITKLSLRENHIGDQALMAVARVFEQKPSLVHLDLSTNDIGDKGCVALANAVMTQNNLITLDLSHNCIANKGCEALAVALSRNMSLTSLDLSNNKIEDSGCEALAKVFCANAKYTQQMPGIKYTVRVANKGWQIIAHAVDSDTIAFSLNLKFNLIGEKSIHLLPSILANKENASIEKVDFRHNRNISKETCAAIGTIRTEALSLGYANIGDDGCQALSNALVHNDYLLSLDLKGNNIGLLGCQALVTALDGECTRLSLLDLSNNAIGDAGCECLSNVLALNHTLVELNLSYNNIGDYGCSCLVKSFAPSQSDSYLSSSPFHSSSLKKLILSYNNGISYQGWRTLDDTLYKSRNMRLHQFIEYHTQIPGVL